MSAFDRDGNVKPSKTSDDIKQTARDDQNRGESREMGRNTTADERNSYWGEGNSSSPCHKW